MSESGTAARSSPTPLRRSRACARAPARGGVTLERAAGLGQTLTAALVCSRLRAQSTARRWRRVPGGAKCCRGRTKRRRRAATKKNSVGGDEDLVDRRSRTTRTFARCAPPSSTPAHRRRARSVLLTSSSKSLDGPFLGGKSPDAAGAYLVAVVGRAQPAASGVARCFAASATTARRVRSRSWARPRRSRTCAWSARPSWRAVMRAEDTVSSAASLRPLVDGLVAAAPDA